jgi:hypothetical protein
VHSLTPINYSQHAGTAGYFLLLFSGFPLDDWWLKIEDWRLKTEYVGLMSDPLLNWWSSTDFLSRSLEIAFQILDTPIKQHLISYITTRKKAAVKGKEYAFEILK